ncbi:YdhK family protein [Cytobacillus praedii]|uniref:YdhK family protein n=1 Tax=Cytobacillus praedii TaxID=1742358 RepID=UPI003F80E59F
MLIRRKRVFLTVFAAIFLVLGACSNDTDKNTKKSEEENTESADKKEGMDHSNMDMSSSGEIPEDLKAAENPTYPVGSKAKIESDHMEGMKGAEATIVGAYDTIAYTISYTPTTGGERVENHKWVIHEEIPEAGDKPLEPGSEFVINASHMKGMDGATAEIDTAEETTVYMVDFTTTTSGEEIRNHKWVTESELSPIK